MVRKASKSTVICCPSFVVLSAVSHYGTLPSIKTMGNISEHVAHSIPTSPSHGSLALCSTFSPPHQQVIQNPSSSHSEVSSPIFKGNVTLERRHRTHLAKVKLVLLEFNLNNKLLYRAFNAKQTKKS